MCSAVSDSLQPHVLQSARLLCPWDSPGKHTGVGCHFLLQGNLPDPGIETLSPALAGRFFSFEPLLLSDLKLPMLSGDFYCYIYCVLITGTTKLIKKTVCFRMQWLEENTIKNINSDGGTGIFSCFNSSLFSTSYFAIQIVLLLRHLRNTVTFNLNLLE